MNGNSYRDASMGMRHLFKAEILQIIAVAFLLISAVLTVAGVAIGSAASEGAVDGAALTGLMIPALIMGLICSLLFLISFIMKLVGLNLAGHDHIYFKYAFGLVFVGILLTVGSAIFSTNDMVSGILSTLAECVDVIIMILVVYGCVMLLNKKGNASMVYSGYTVLNMMILANIISVLARFLPIFVGSDVWDLIFIVFYVVLSVMSGIMFLVFLKKASKALI